MNQEAEKIINIEHAENVHIDAPGLDEAAEKLGEMIDALPEIIERTIMMFFSKQASADPSEITMCKDPSISPMSLENIFHGPIGIGDIVMSHWQIDRCIGKGSISTVYEAHHTKTSYRSAVKVIHSSFQFFDYNKTDATHRVYNASDMIRMELDNMVALKGTGYIVDYDDHEVLENSDGSQDIIIRMELLQPISDILRVKTPARGDVIRLGIDICKALEFCNKNNIIHCDVKPSNIYLNKWGGYKLGDFSASTKIGDKQEQEQIGTLKYMAPEVYQGKPFTPNIDTYSLGLVMYELLKVNKLKDPASREAALSDRLSSKPLPSIPGIDKALQSVILKACAYNPKERFSSPTEMLRELKKLEHGRKIPRKYLVKR